MGSSPWSLSRLVCQKNFSWRLQTIREETTIPPLHVKIIVHVQLGTPTIVNWTMAYVHVHHLLLLSFLLATMAWKKRIKERITGEEEEEDQPTHPGVCL